MSKANSNRPPEEPKPTARKVRWWVKALVIFHVVAITVWATPNPTHAYDNGRAWHLRTDGLSNFAQSLNDGYRVFNQRVLKTSPFKFYLLSTGTWQYWDMFAPNPADTDFYGDAVITYRDGTTKLYTYPRMYKMDLVTKYLKERYRKYYERANSEDYRYTWVQFAQYLALINYKSADNPPVKIVLQRHWMPVQPMDKPQLKDYNSYAYFEYEIDQEQLAHDAKSMFVKPYVPKF